MTRLSVNLNKVALLRNQRDVGVPNLVHAAEASIDAGASGITVHPRPDERHTRFSDVHDLSAFTAERGVEFNIEGNPTEESRDSIRASAASLCLVSLRSRSGCL